MHSLKLNFGSGGVSSIDGVGQKITIDGNSVPIFNVTADASLSLNDLTLAHAFQGAVNKGNVGLINCLTSGNYGAVTITASIIIDCGAGNIGNILRVQNDARGALRGSRSHLRTRPPPDDSTARNSNPPETRRAPGSGHIPLP